MKKTDLITPATLVDLCVLENNIKRYQEVCDNNNKQLWPMLKTHKSTEIIKMQLEAGATGFLGGTLEECEAACSLGVKNIMYAYPVGGGANLKRVVELAKKCEFIIRLDSVEAAEAVNSAAANENVVVKYSIIVDIGFHRFGIIPEKLIEFAQKLKKFKNIRLCAISTHPGGVYASKNRDEVYEYAKNEAETMKKAAEILRASGFELDYVTSGSTPTHMYAVKMDGIDVYHPGNYVFQDNFQVANGTATPEDCAISVLTTIISHPSEELYICDAGSKCLGLDQGAHGLTTVKGFGVVKGHPELIVYSLSEEVGKLHVDGKTNIKIGDVIEISPNHSCPVVSSMTSYLAGCRGDNVERFIEIDLRKNFFMGIFNNA